VDRSSPDSHRPATADPTYGLQAAKRVAQQLALLNTGAPHATIANRLELSTRTMQRRLRDLTERLGGRTRFQAGVQASRLGWLDSSTADPGPSPVSEQPPRHAFGARGRRAAYAVRTLVVIVQRE
jgi:hypothetical protein